MRYRGKIFIKQEKNNKILWINFIFLMRFFIEKNYSMYNFITIYYVSHI